jgi:hypothetical protein
VKVCVTVSTIVVGLVIVSVLIGKVIFPVKLSGNLELVAVDVAFAEVEVAFAEVDVEIGTVLLAAGAVAFVFPPSVPDEHVMLIEGAAAWNATAPF